MTVLQGGEVDYGAGLALQATVSDQVRDDPDSPRLILLRHPPVFTVGKFGDETNLLDPHGIPVHRTDRGGDVTYHGPGQIIGYPIIALRAHHIGIRTFVRRIERVLIQALFRFGVDARRKEDCVGAWTDRGKVASIGVRVDRGVTRHGFSLQVRSEPEPYTYMNPCGMPGCPVTSVEEETGSIPDDKALREEIVLQFLDQFKIQNACETPFPAI